MIKAGLKEVALIQSGDCDCVWPSHCLVIGWGLLHRKTHKKRSAFSVCAFCAWYLDRGGLQRVQKRISDAVAPLFHPQIIETGTYSSEQEVAL